jgi:hypothetical protein
MFLKGRMGYKNTGDVHQDQHLPQCTPNKDGCQTLLNAMPQAAIPA